MAEISIPGDPSGLAGLAAQLDAASSHVGSVQNRVEGKGLHGAWSGGAADAFRSTLHQLPGELGKVAQAFGDAGAALSAFSSTLSDLQQKADWYNRQLEGARHDAAVAESSQRSAESEVRAAQQRHGAASDPISQRAAQNAIDAGERAAGQAAAHLEESAKRISDLEGAAARLREEYDHAVQSCCSTLEGTGHAGHHSLLNWVRDRVKDIGHYTEHSAIALLHGAKSAVEDVESIGGDALETLDKNWADWRKFLIGANSFIGNATIDIGAGLLALAGAVAFIPGGGDVVAGALLGLDEALVAGASKLQAVDRGLIMGGDMIEGEVMGRSKYRQYLLDDAVEMGVSFTGGKLAEAGLKRAGKELDSIPAIHKAAGKLMKMAEDDPAVKVTERVVVDEAKMIKGHVVGAVEHGVENVIEEGPKALISPPLERPFTLRIPLLPELAAN